MVEDADYETELYYTSYIELMTLKFKMNKRIAQELNYARCK